MEDQRLCKNCIEWLRKKYGDNAYSPPSQHCHHPEPACWWCEDWIAFEKDYKGMATYEVVKKLIGLNPENPECPNCSKRLTF